MNNLHPLYWAERTPEKPAWWFADQATSYQELAKNMLKGAHWLRKQGIKSGDTVAIVAENRNEFLFFFWSAQICGVYFTPISVQYKAREINQILSNCQAKAIAFSPKQKNKIQGISNAIYIDLSKWRDIILSEPESLIKDASEGAEMLYSSGTTGTPKGIRNQKPGRKLGEISELFKKRLGLHEIDSTTIYLSPAPLYHSAPLRYNNMVLRAGGTSVIMPRFDARSSLKMIDKYRVTHSQWVPTMFTRLLNLPNRYREMFDLSSHRIAIHAAAPCPIILKEQMIEWWGPIIYEYYSGTEGNGQTAISPAEWQKHKGSVGKPILGKLHIMDAQNQELAAHHVGDIFFSGGPDFTYYNDPKKTAESYNSNGWSTLGDIGFTDDEGYLYLTDRKSHTIISGGVNIYPREVEDILLIHSMVLDAAVFGIPNPEFGEEVKAAIQLKSGASVNEEELISFCKKHLAHLKCPKTIDFHDELPRHQTGKIYKEELKKPYWKS